MHVTKAHHATYLRISTADVAHSVHLSELVVVDVDMHGDPVGVEFTVAPRDITVAMLCQVAAAYPELRPVIAGAPGWLLTRRAPLPG